MTATRRTRRWGRAAQLLSRCALVACTVVSIVRPLGAQSAPNDSTVRALLQSRIALGYTTGVVVGKRIGTSDRVIAEGVGEISGAPLSGTSIFEIGSITKGFTGLLLADMVLRGEVELDDPVSKYLPSSVSVPSWRGTSITLLDLATASSGLPSLPSNFSPAEPKNPYADYTVAQLYAFLADFQLKREPGALYEYSNLGMGLLGHALALRAGMSYEALVTARILAPLDMRETFIGVPAALEGRRAVPHDSDLDPTSPWYLPTLAGAGALRSTTRDLLRLVHALTHRDEGPLAQAITLAITPRRPTTTPNMRIGLAWHIRETLGRQIVWHNGGTGGFRTFLGFDLASGAHSVVWSNSGVSVDDIGMHLLDSTVSLIPTPVRADLSVPLETLRNYVGEYALSPLVRIAITERQGKLYLQATNQPRFRLWAESPTQFYLRSVPARIGFERESTGDLVLLLEQNGAKQRAKRVGGG